MDKIPRINIARKLATAILIFFFATLNIANSMPIVYAQSFDLAQMESEVKKRIYSELESRINKKFDDVNAIVHGWAANAVFKTTLKYMADNPKAVELFKKARKEGKTPEQAFKLALRSAEIKDDSALVILRGFDIFVNSDGIAILKDLKNVAANGKAQLNAFFKLSEELEVAKDRDTYIAAMEKFGIKGWKKFEALEKRMTKLYNFVQNPYGKYSEIFATIQKGIDGNETESDALALFTLMEKTGSALPVLGTFVELYATVATELLNATLRLRKSFSRWDMGCVGTGTYGFLDEAKKKDFKYPGMACPDGTIQGLFEDFSRPDKLYFWDGKVWHEGPNGSGGLLAMRGIITFLETVKNTLPAAKSDVLSAFEFYGIPGGYVASYKDATRVHNGITETWNRLKQTMASFDISKDRIIEILEQRAGIAPGFDVYLDNHFKKQADLFVYSYLKSSASLGIIALEHLTTYGILREFRPKIVLGKIILPDGIDVTTTEPTIEITKNSDVYVEKQSISLSSLTYQIVLFGAPGARLDYRVHLGSFRSDVLSVDVWKSRFTKHQAVFTAALGVDLTLPPIIIVGQDTTISGRITPHAESPDNNFQLSWTIDGTEVGTSTVSGTEFTIPLVFNQAGRIDFEVTAVDGNGISGGEREDIPVAFKMDTELQTSEAGELVVMVSIGGGSGEYTVTWLTDTGIGIEKSVGRNKFFQRFKEDSTSMINWIDLTVFDTSRQIEVPTRIFVEGSIPVDINLTAVPNTIANGETVDVVALITGGLPDYLVVLYANDREIGRRDTSRQSERFSLTFDVPTTYQLRAVVTDADGGTAESSALVIVEEAAALDEDPEAEVSVSILTGEVGSFNVSKSGYKWLGRPGRMNGSVEITISGSNATANVNYEFNDIIYTDYPGFANGVISGYFTAEGKLALAGRIPYQANDISGCEETNRSGDPRECQGSVAVRIKGQRVGNRIEGSWQFDGRHDGTWQGAAMDEVFLNPDEVATLNSNSARTVNEFETGVANSNEYDLFKDALLDYFK